MTPEQRREFRERRQNKAPEQREKNRQRSQSQPRQGRSGGR
jgi:hypothetical protein